VHKKSKNACLNERFQSSTWLTMTSVMVVTKTVCFHCTMHICTVHNTASHGANISYTWTSPASSDTVSFTFTSYHTRQFIIFTIFTITIFIFSHPFSLSFWPYNLALWQILSTIDLFLPARLTPRILWRFNIFYRAACNADAVLWWEFCLSVCHTRGLWQNGKKICPDLYTIWKNI